jgi:pimeloyl-ACP methyl ester carboxylesterase
MTPLKKAAAAEPSDRQIRRRRAALLLGSTVGCLAGFGSFGWMEVFAQAPKPAAPAAAAPVPAAPVAAPPVDTTPQRLELTTKDQVQIHCTYYPGMHGKQTVPVILLHGWDGPRGAGSGQDVTDLALVLQKEGHAVMVPDLRGHGRSTVRQTEGQPPLTIDRDKLRPADLQAMTLDVEAVRSFLVGQNNTGHLNLELLCVVGFEMGALVALNWTHYDWSVPSLPTLKQGQDVKAFVLVSPDQAFRGMTTRRALANPAVRGDLSALILYGRDDPTGDASKRLYNTLKRAHRPVPSGSPDAEKEKLQDLFVAELSTSLRGTKLLASQTLNVTDRIRDFIQRRLTDRQEFYPWRDRSLP